MNPQKSAVANARDVDQRPPKLTLQQLVNELDELDSPADLLALKSLLCRLEIDPDELEEFSNFSESNYQRNLVARCKHFEALLLCFKAGQRTPIHDHAGSACGVKVIQGVATETVYDTTSDGWLYATGSCHLEAPGVVGSVDMDIHQLSNLQSENRELITLHIYSPPLGEVGNYNVDDNSKILVTAPTRQATEQ